MAEAVVVVMGCTYVLGPPAPLRSVKSWEQDPVHSVGSEHHSSVLRGCGCLSLAAQTRERWQFLSVRGGSCVQNAIRLDGNSIGLDSG